MTTDDTKARALLEAMALLGGSLETFFEAEEARQGPPRWYSGLSPVCPKCSLDEDITATYCVG